MDPKDRRKLAALAGAAAVAGAVLWRRRSDADADTDVAAATATPVMGASALGRNARLGVVGARSAGRYAAHRARRTFADAERREALDTEFQMRTAEDVAAALGDMKGALMKIGQMASYLDQGLPEPVREALAQLRSDAPPMAPELAAQVIREQLGADPDDLFAEWDPVPIASASIGQVHRALTKDDRAVAVKVQYPGVAAAIRSDMASGTVLFHGLGAAFPGLDPGPIIQEIKARITEELDYALEARNQALFSAAYRGHPFIHVPEVVPELSTARVVTTELASGVPFEDVVAGDQADRDRAGEVIYRFVFRSLYRLRAFNGDPHPGNYLFGADGTVTFLDFGLVKHFAPEELQVFSAMVEAMSADRDHAKFRAIVEEVGLLAPGHPATDDQVADYFGHFYEMVDRRGPFTFTPEYSSETMRRIFDQSGPYAELQRAANVPPSFVIAQRINLGVYAILGELRATGDWRAMAEELWPFVDAPPRTELGHQEHEWIARRAAEGDPTPLA